ncbi:hypothetical protein TRFO_27700 [Tritrichomonas foetus]|uniref:Uncharacterized protein n=1 Tax=Tritrichomonas foetus TaxID=1144522 RepID=A0A1J4K0D9_9EUKA|nr:hypothetical protein TRFO_27700 [Tritrichomonas foetus]|eukprot:OHT04699.1 hypothetical protein TRFO_27700 [Tritrichomonas foetus]
MSVDHETQLKQELEILEKIQEMMMYILDCDEECVFHEINKLFTFIESISISTNFSIYEGFLRILMNLSLYFTLPQKYQKRQSVFYDILNQLIVKHSLKTVFHPLTIYCIFQQNKHILLFLLENGIIDISLIKKEIYQHTNKNFLLFFLPEIEKSDSKFWKEQKKLFHISKEEIFKIYNNVTLQNSNDKIEKDQERNNKCETFYEIRKENHSNEEIARIIRKDDLNSFLNFFVNNHDFDHGYTIKPSVFENNPDMNRDTDGISLLEYSMAFGSINIFRYLWLNHAKYSENSLKYSIIGGNYEIIHILEEESQYQFPEDCYWVSIKYDRNEISEYLLTSILREQSLFTQKFNFNDPSPNLKIVKEYLKKMISNKIGTYNESDIFNTAINHKIIYSDQLYFSHDFYEHIPYFCFCFLIHQSSIDMNSYNDIFLLTHHYSLISFGIYECF